MFTRMFMATKTLTIMEDAYEMLLSKKTKNESFSDVIRRIAGEKGDISQFFGAWKHLSKDEVESRKRRILEMRKESTHNLLKRRKELWKR